MASTSAYTQWASLPDDEITTNYVETTLSAVPDDLWVAAAACLDRAVNNTEVQESLLKLGISRTERVIQRCQDTLASEETEAPDTIHNSLVEYFVNSPIDARLCNIRSILLQRLDRLNTYVEMEKSALESGDTGVEDDVDEWEDDPWADGTAGSSTSTTDTRTKSSPQLPVSLSSFLLGDIVRLACELASLEAFSALHILFKRHGPVLWPFRFVILENIPEHIHPSLYNFLLPSYSPATNSEPTMISEPWRMQPDFVEARQCQSALQESNLALDQVHTVDGVGYEAHHLLLSDDELSTWYKNRVNRVIHSSGMIDIALAIVQHGASQGIPGLDELGEELSLLSRLVYDAPQADEMDDDWTLARWYSLEPLAVVHAYLAHSTPGSLAEDISRLVMPYLYVLEARAERAGSPDPSLPTRILYEYILSAPLEKAAVIFEASKPTLPPAQRLIRDDEDIARLALACLYGSDSLDEWSTMSRIFECLPAWDISRDDDNDEDVADTTVASLGTFVKPSIMHPCSTPSELLILFKPLSLSSLSRALDILDVHLESGEIFSRWSVPAPLRWFLQSNGDINEQRSWANRMARRAGGQQDQLNTQEDWEWLLEDMLKLTGKGDNGLKGAFGLLSRDEVTRIFLSGLLSTGKFDIAKAILRSPRNKIDLDANTIEDICISCFHELYDNASSGNYKIGDMKLAYDCLDIPRSSNRLVKEKQFVEATSRISSFNVQSRPGIPISPIEIRLTKDRLSLISRVLSSNNDAYKHTEVILDLSYKLGFAEDVVAEVKVLAMLADTALQAEDFERAYENSERMVDIVFKLRASSELDADDPRIHEVTEVCWIACFQLGRQPEFEELGKRMLLLGRALELCPAEKLHDVLTAWQRLENEDIQNREERMTHRRSGTAAVSSPRKLVDSSLPINVASTLRARLQDFHMPSPPLLSTPDAAALASRTFKSVAANFPFGHRGRSQLSETDDTGSHRSTSTRRTEGEDVSAHATRVLSKGIGWLIGADEE
ncbi:secretory pathway protein Sec39-domain-containing protein [Crucibulum laeve]|uniref:Secretory pathway protein Sec39-domain-containing protein n=1 Tax=Crucibulum laeve TaxID=68775 RepID=A0A5C3LV33_9AGAR|nr:secretory pathway protein Sec39-domain-containing protein [Crucibulum laeve]